MERRGEGRKVRGDDKGNYNLMNEEIKDQNSTRLRRRLRSRGDDGGKKKQIRETEIEKTCFRTDNFEDYYGKKMKMGGS